MEFYPALSIMKVVSDESLSKEVSNPNFMSPRDNDAFGQQTLQMANSIDSLVSSLNNNLAMTEKSKSRIKEAILTICTDDDKREKLSKVKRIPLCTEALKGCEVQLHPDVLHMLWAFIREAMKNQGFTVGSRYGFIGYSNPTSNLEYPYNTVIHDMENKSVEYIGETLNNASKEISVNRSIRKKLEELVFTNR